MGYNSISGFSKSSHLIFANILCVANKIQRGVDAFKIKERSCRMALSTPFIIIIRSVVD